MRSFVLKALSLIAPHFRDRDQTRCRGKPGAQRVSPELPDTTTSLPLSSSVTDILRVIVFMSASLTIALRGPVKPGPGVKCRRSLLFRTCATTTMASIGPRSRERNGTTGEHLWVHVRRWTAIPDESVRSTARLVYEDRTVQRSGDYRRDGRILSRRASAGVARCRGDRRPARPAMRGQANNQDSLGLNARGSSPVSGPESATACPVRSRCPSILLPHFCLVSAATVGKGSRRFVDAPHKLKGPPEGTRRNRDGDCNSPLLRASRNGFDSSLKIVNPGTRTHP